MDSSLYDRLPAPFPSSRYGAQGNQRQYRFYIDSAMVASAPSHVVYYASLGFRTEPGFSFCLLCAQRFSPTSTRLGQDRASVAAAVHLRARACACSFLLLAAIAMDTNSKHRVL